MMRDLSFDDTHLITLRRIRSRSGRKTIMQLPAVFKAKKPTLEKYPTIREHISMALLPAEVEGDTPKCEELLGALCQRLLLHCFIAERAVTTS